MFHTCPGVLSQAFAWRGFSGHAGSQPSLSRPRGAHGDVEIVLHLEKLVEAAQKSSTFGFSLTGAQITGVQVAQIQRCEERLHRLIVKLIHVQIQADFTSFV